MVVIDGLAGRRYASTLFDAVVAENASFSIRAELPADAGFLDNLAAACSPLVGLLSDAMIRDQAASQRIGHEAAYPWAMRRIALVDDMPIGRLVIDWRDDHSRCVDIALIPPARNDGIGTALLRAWLIVAGQLCVSATLGVRRDNPAIALYARLGLVAHDNDPSNPYLTMSPPL